MDYEQKYKKALERARQFSETTYLEDSAGIVEYIFPELKESEDEKIRKEIIAFIKSVAYAKTDDVKRYVAWLEKQGNSPIKWNKNTEGNKPRVNHSVLMKTTHGIAEGEWQGERWHQYRWAGIVRDSDVLSWIEFSDLEKQGEQKNLNIIDISEKEKQDMQEENLNSHTELFDINKQGEHKPDDKAEPKFKVGDYVVNNETSNLCHIFKIEYGQYICDDCSFPITKENEYHLWTIQDAKDGDVLSDETTIFIFKDLLSDGSVMSYCDYDTDSGESDAFCPLSMNLMCSKITPATKEQRNTLFAKMREAGYEWDAKNKELKKIMQEPVNYKKQLMNEITDLVKDYITQKPSEWSEEDENYLNTTIAYLKDANEFKKTAEKCITWLKSLRPQKQWKPSEEQMKALAEALSLAKNCGEESAFDLRTLHEQLKKL